MNMISGIAGGLTSGALIGALVHHTPGGENLAALLIDACMISTNLVGALIFGAVTPLLIGKFADGAALGWS